MSSNNGQKGTGFNFLDRIALQNLTSYESRVLLTIIKWHLVYNNGGVTISLSRICLSTGLPERHVCRSLQGLLRKQILFKTHKNGLPFYSFTLPIQTLPNEGGGLPNEGIKYPIRGGDYINRSNEVKNNNAGSADQIGKFTDQYPGTWFKTVKDKADKIFADMSPDDQQKALKALAAYKSSKSVNDGRIFSPANFLKSQEIIDKYSKEAPPAPSATNETASNIEKWRQEQAADPPRGSFKAEFERLTADTANDKSVTKKGRG